MEALRAARPVTVGDVTLIAIEHTGIHSNRGEAGYWLSAFKDAHAVIVCDASGIRAFDAEAAEIELTVLVQKIPGLGRLLAGLSMT